MVVLMVTLPMKTGKLLAQKREALGKAQIILRDAFKDAEKPKEEKTM